MIVRQVTGEHCVDIHSAMTLVNLVMLLPLNPSANVMPTPNAVEKDSYKCPYSANNSTTCFSVGFLLRILLISLPEIENIVINTDKVS